ncbi:MAG: type II toxin-antitoxin system HicB family antitoxin [Brevundimonas sp.]|nr:type II toxin-antitoxin system HicB family antitoxin [Brevundimonas sp.]
MSTVIYVAVVEGDQDRGYSAFFPDLPGCVTAAETMVELPSAARDALSLHLQGMAEDGVAFPEPTALEDIKADAEVKEVGRILVDAEAEDAPVRVNISIGAQFLKRVDVAAEARGMSRSGFLVEAARTVLADNGERESEVLVLPVHGQRGDEPAHFGAATIVTLGAHMCKWPIGDPSSMEFSFCGRRVSDGVYCVEHARVAYQPQVRRNLPADDRVSITAASLRTAI